MPELFIPVYFGSNDFQNHFITAWADDIDKKRIATGSINGDIIIWEFDNFNLKPLIKSTPHLIYRVRSHSFINNEKTIFRILGQQYELCNSNYLRQKDKNIKYVRWQINFDFRS